MIPTVDPTPRVFRVQDGVVTGNTGQEDANNFAADFQGLRHFGNLIGEALDLGHSKLAALQEADFAHLWTKLSEADEVAGGAMVLRKASLSELRDFAVTAPEV
jgi:hypothetical protein